MTKSELVTWIQLKYPKLVKAMKECSHHLDEKNLNPHHLEGDVWTHTLMVLNQVPESASEVVKIAALLHDIGKPMVREISDKGRVRFFNHESVGAFLSLSILKDPKLELSDEEKIRIFKLICLHTEGYKLTSDQMSDLMTNELSLSGQLKELVNADQNGRFATDENKDLDFSYKSRPYSYHNKELILMVGLPYSGKSTYVSELQKQGYTVISRDSIIESMYPDKTYNEAYSEADQKVVSHELSVAINKARKDDKVVIDMTNMTKKGRRKFLDQFPNHHKKAVVCLVDLETLMKRNNQRLGKVISEDVIEKMVKSFYLPTYQEFDEIEWRLV